MLRSLCAALVLCSLVSGSSLPHDQAEILRRADGDSYAPSKVDCPADRPVIRPGSSLSDSEKQWRRKRQQQVVPPLKEYLSRAGIPNFDGDGYLDKLTANHPPPNIAIAVAGGGYRAMLVGAGGLAAFDDRVEGSAQPGGLGGLLQSATAISGLSGGSWLLGSIYTNNFSTTPALFGSTDSSESGNIWKLEKPLFQGPPGGVKLIAAYFWNLYQSLKAKADAGFQITITDLWARMLGFQLVDGNDGAPKHTWSSIATQPKFADAHVPLPFVLTRGRTPDTVHIAAALNTSIIFEFTPWEFGTYNEQVGGMVPLEYLGSPFDDGKIPAGQKCVTGYDNAGLVLGTSSSLFNEFALKVRSTTAVPGFLRDFLLKILGVVTGSNTDVAAYNPNPYKNYQPSAQTPQQQRAQSSNPWASSSALTLTDVGEDGTNIPFYPHLHPERSTDVILALDSGADTPSLWPNGSEVTSAYQRAQFELSPSSSFGPASGASNFPPVPDPNTFINLGLNTRPTFFGCDARNQSAGTPLIVYLPNAPYSYMSNVSTFATHFPQPDAPWRIARNGYDIATMGNGTRVLPLARNSGQRKSANGTTTTTDDVQKEEGQKWAVCLACAVLSRSMERAQVQPPDACEQCFRQYCWDGTVNATEPAAYLPPSFLPPSGSR